MTEKLKREGIKYACDYPTSYGKGYKRVDLRKAYIAGAEPREKKIAKLEEQITKWKEDYIALENLKDNQIEKMKSCCLCVHCGKDCDSSGCGNPCDKWELAEN